MDARDTIYQEITEHVEGSKKVTGDAYMIVCPFHGDTDPSLGVNLTTDTSIPLGTFHCFGCGAKGNWNGLAKKLGLTQLKEWELGFVGNGTKQSHRKRKTVFYEDEQEILKKSIYTNAAIKWPESVEWRGYDGKLLRKLGAIYYSDNLTNQMMTFFPINIADRYRGGVRAYTEKQVNGNSYLTTKGGWVKDYGLLGYSYVKKIVRKYKYDAVVLVEGPRDLLRLLSNHIPALAVLGVEVVSEKKILNVLSLSDRIKTIYVLPDNDKAGRILVHNIKAATGDLAAVKHLKLPRPKKKGKLVKIDPDSCSQEIIDEIRLLMKQHKLTAANS